MRRTLGRSGFWLGLLIGLTGTATAANADVMYDYAGSLLFSNGVPTGRSITGDIVLANPIPPSTEIDNPTLSSFQSFSFTDGISTISNTTPNVTVGVAAGGANYFVTNSSGQITQGDLTIQAVTPIPGLLPGSNTIQFANITPFGNSFSDTVPTAGGACCIGLGGGSNQTAGTWTGPLTVTPPPPGPSLYLTVNTRGASSLSGGQIGIDASLTLATTQPSGSYPLLTTALPTDAHTLQDAATDLGYIGFDWVQTLSGPSPLPLYACNDILCSSTTEVVGSTIDPPTNGYNYCNPADTTHFIPNSVAGNTCAHNQGYYYDPFIAENPSDSNTTCVIGIGAGCTDMTTSNDTALNFFDAPRDPCLANQFPAPGLPVGSPSQAYQLNSSVKDLCQNQGGTTLGAELFVTTLVGLTGSGAVDLASFDWTTTFNGYGSNQGTGSALPGSIFLFASDTSLEADPTTGTGGIVITEIDGQPVSTVPEPPTIIILMGAIILLIHAKIRHGVYACVANTFFYVVYFVGRLSLSLKATI